MAPTESSSRDSFREFADKGLTLVGKHETDIALLGQDLAAIKTRDQECRQNQHASWQRWGERMMQVEKVVSDLSGTVDRFIKSHDAGAVAAEAARVEAAKAVEEARVAAAAAVESIRAEAAKGAEGRQGRRAQIVCTVITVIGALIVGYMSYSAKVTSADLPAAVSAAVAEGVKQALSAAH